MKKLLWILPTIILLWAFDVHSQQRVQSCAASPNATGCANVLTPIGNTAVASSLILKASPAYVVGFQMSNTNASLRWAFLYDGTTVPSNGTLTACANYLTVRPCVAKYYELPATTTIGASWAPGPFLATQSGAILLCSSTGPLTLTLATDCMFSGDVQ